MLKIYRLWIMKIGHLLSKNRNRLGVFTYENAIKRHFYLSVKWQQNVSGLSDSNRDDVSYVHYYALAFPFEYLSPYPAKNKYFVMPFIQNNVLNRQIQNLFPMAFWRWEGREKALTSVRQVHVFILRLEFIAKSFPSYLQRKSPGDKVGKCIFCALAYCFF